MTGNTFTAVVKVRMVKAGLQAYIEYPTKKGGLQATTLNKQILSKPLAELFDKKPQQLEDVEVEYLLEAGKVKKVTEKGKVWEPHASQSSKRSNTRGRHSAGGPQAHQRQPQGTSPRVEEGRRFENPYNFVPALPRDIRHPELGDAAPAGHHRWFPERWSGHISLTMQTCTPLLIPYPISDVDGHKTFEVRVDENGVPYLPATSIKGALRSAYEAITNSRMGVFTGHSDPLAYRKATDAGMRVVPAMVTQEGSCIQLQPGISKILDDGSADARLQYAAWLPQYKGKEKLLQYGKSMVKHGAKVWARLEHWEHKVSLKGSEKWTRDFTFLRVVAIASDAPRAPDKKGTNSRSVNCPKAELHRRGSYSTPLEDESSFWQLGRICLTGRNMSNKHDERLFFISDAHPQSGEVDIQISDRVRLRWRTLIENYQAEHIEETLNGSLEFSRHITGGKLETELTDGTLCYATVERSDQGSLNLLALYPVQIARDLYDVAPEVLLDASLASAKHLDKLSPADRVFGWVGSQGAGSYKGQLRIGTAICHQGKAAIEEVGGEGGVPLAILGQPKPAQARFYAAQNSQGEPLGAMEEKTSGYRESPKGGIDQSSNPVSPNRLRGRKVYPHHRQAAMAENYWSENHPVSQPIPIENHAVYQEWRSHDNVLSTQNRSMTAWVKPGTCFTIPIQVTNLSAVELGALLWLVHLGDDRHLRIGGGKPLGFGSVRLSVDTLDLRIGEAVREDYLAFDSVSTKGRRVTSLEQASDLIESYRIALPEVISEPGQQFDQLRIIRAFLNASTGGSLPVHYPRTREQQKPQGEGFKWFGENEHVKKGSRPGHSLPPLWDDNRGLPEL